jgi:hypothetical protein
MTARNTAWDRVLVSVSLLLALTLALPDLADGKHKRPKRRNGVAAFAPAFTPEIGAFTCAWSEAPWHDYMCNTGLAVGQPTFELLEPVIDQPGRLPNALVRGGDYPHDPDVDGFGGGFPLASPDIATRFSCQWAATPPPLRDPAMWQCGFTYNAHTHRFTVKEIVSAAYEVGSDTTEQWFVPCDGVGPCPEEDRPPDTEIQSGPSGAVASTSAVLRFTASEPGSTFQCRLGSAVWATCVSPERLSRLPDAEHVFEARAIDDRGNIDATPARHRWRVDTTGPHVKISRRPVRLTRAGVAKVRLRCRRSERSGPCSVRLRLATRHGVRLGTKHFALVVGRAKRIRVQLGRRKRALVAHRGHLPVRAKVRVHDRLGNAARSRGTFTLRAP